MKKLDKAEIDNDFDTLDGSSFVYLVNPNIFKDDRGWFMERMQFPGSNFMDIKQINRSCSKPGVIRGCHAQKGPYCQAKLVEAINADIVDVITDMRPQSKTFGKSKMYFLSSYDQNMLYVPKGFLHGFIVPKSAHEDAYFNYYCDEKYDKSSEVGVNPVDVIGPLLNDLFNSPITGKYAKICLALESDNDDISTFILSDKDKTGIPFAKFMSDVKEEYKNGKLWYE